MFAVNIVAILATMCDYQPNVDIKEIIISFKHGTREKQKRLA